MLRCFYVINDVLFLASTEASTTGKRISELLESSNSSAKRIRPSCESSRECTASATSVTSPSVMVVMMFVGNINF